MIRYIEKCGSNGFERGLWTLVASKKNSMDVSGHVLHMKRKTFRNKTVNLFDRFRRELTTTQIGHIIGSFIDVAKCIDRKELIAEKKLEKMTIVSLKKN